MWVYGAASRSDGPALTLGIIGLTLALRGLRSPRCPADRRSIVRRVDGRSRPVLFAVGPRSRVYCLLASAPAAGGSSAGRSARGRRSLSWYVPLVLHTGWRAYRVTISEHARYTYATDSFFAEGANTVLRAYRLQRFFVSIWGRGRYVDDIYLRCRGRHAARVAATMAGDWGAGGVLPANHGVHLAGEHPAERPPYSLSYVPLFVGLAGFSIVTAPRLLVQAGRWRGLGHIGLILASGVVVGMIHWSYPIIEMRGAR